MDTSFFNAHENGDESKINFQDMYNENLRLSKKVCSLEGQNMCLQNIKRELLDQLGERKEAYTSMEREAKRAKSQLKSCVEENLDLQSKLSALEVFLTKCS